MKKTCDIVICIWNNLEVTRDCIESIYKNTAYPYYRLVLIDNASDEPTKSYLESIKNDPRFNVILIRNEENLGNTKAVNQGLKASDAAYVCNLDNDTYVTDGWLSEMITIAESDPTIGIVAPGRKGGQPLTSNSIIDIEAKAKDIAQRKGQQREMALIDCFCALIKREVINTVGLWDEIYSPGYYDDSDYCRRTVAHGYKLVCALGAYVYHREGGSFKKRNKFRDEIFARNQKIYNERYGESKRILYVIDHLNKHMDQICADILQQARQTNWVWINQKISLASLPLTAHSHINIVRYTPFFFTLRNFFKIIFRKKKFNDIYADNSFLLRLLAITKPFHRANVTKIK